MDWHIEEFINENTMWNVANGVEKHPQHLLGPHGVEDGYVIVAMHPSAKKMQVRIVGEKECTDMERIQETGIYAAYIQEEMYQPYELIQIFEDTSQIITEDPYCFPSLIEYEDCQLWQQGIHYHLYEKMGAHLTKLQGVYGTYFAVWAPNAKRVSVVGSFNMWDGRIHPMRGREDMGIFELFIPHAPEGAVYQYEIVTKENKIIRKSDPFANQFEMRPKNASIVTEIEGFVWSDAVWMNRRKKKNSLKTPMNIYEVHLGSWKKENGREGGFKSYKELAKELAEYCEYMGYTHVELLGILEHPFDGSWGYQVTGYYAPTVRYGTPKDFMYFVNYMHEHGISVLLDWVPAHFPKDEFALGRFDGTPLFEHPDPRRGEHPDWGTYIFNYGKPEVSNFLIANAFFWVEKFHIDGLRTDAVASMLYLDYGRQNGNWLPNQYGGHENLEAVELFKHLNSIMAKKNPGICMIAEESTAWPNVTKPPEEEGLGFQYKWNMGWMNDFLEYVRTDPIYRKYMTDKLTFSMVYHHAEKYILVLSHDEVVHGKRSMLEKMPGEMNNKFRGLRTSYGFMFGHPGKKLLFMGQDFGQLREWSEERSLDWYLLEDGYHKKLQLWVRALLHLETKYKALYETDYEEYGFQWIQSKDEEHSVYSFIRVSPNGKKSLLFICNFLPAERRNFTVGVPNIGKYKEILNSEDIQFGGDGEYANGDLRASAKEWDGRPFSIQVQIPPMGCLVFEYLHRK